MTKPDSRPPQTVDRRLLGLAIANFVLVMALLMIGGQVRRWNALAGLAVGVVVGVYAWRSTMALLRRRT